MKISQSSAQRRIFLLALVAVITFSAGVSAQTSSVLNRSWNDRGAAPLLFASSDAFTDRPVTGAINSIAAHPTNADILYIGAVNGGVWRTTNATAANPNWTQLTDTFDSLSVGKVVLDPTDATSQTVLVGAGRFSSFGRRGGSRAGIFRSTDGGDTFSALTGFPVGRNVSGLAARGANINVTIDVADNFTCGNVGLFRSTDTGASFGRAAGIPVGVNDVLVGDPTDNNILFTTVIFADVCTAGGVNGMYRSTDGGANWTKVSDAAIDAQLTNAGAHVEMSVGSNDNVYAAIATGGVLTGLFRSGDGGGTWVALDIPGTFEPAFIGIHPGGQGGLHLSIAADPTNDNLVYVAGDRQPRNNNDTGGFPNSIGSNTFTGRVFRVDASAASGSQSTPLTHNFTANGTAPHADSRDMAFLADGRLAQADDGGIYTNPTPQNATGDWFSLNGDMQVNEAHNTDYDSNSDILRIGLQDNGTGRQFTPAGLVWNEVTGGDGGDVGTDVLVRAGMNQSVGYLSFQNLGAFRRIIWDENNNFISQAFPALNVTSGAAIDVSFTTPFAVNKSVGGRILIGADNGVYESLDQGDTVTQLLPEIFVISGGLNALEYGAANNGDRIYVGGCIGSCTNNGDGADGIFTRDTIGNNLTNIFSTTSPIRGVSMNPSDQNDVAFIESARVLITTNAGGTVTDVTGDLPVATTGALNSILLIDRSSEPGFGDQLVVGTDRGIYIAHEASGFLTWDSLGTSLPNAPVFELRHDPANDLLIAGTLGRGVFSIDLSNQSPVAAADSETTALNTAVMIDVLDNDMDPDGDDLTISSSGNGSNGTVAVAGDNLSLTYTPDNGFNGTDSFTYTITDGRATADAMVMVTVGSGANAVNDTASVLEDGGTITIDVLANDTGPAPLTITAANADSGTAVINSGMVDYTPAQDFFGTATINYSISDGMGGTDSAEVDVTVTSVNDVPSFNLAGNQAVNEDAGAQSVAGFASNILAGPANESGQQLNFIVGNDNAALFSQAPSIDASTGNLTYTLANDANGVANVTVQLMDDGGTDNGGVDTSAQQNFSITVNSVNDAPSFNIGGNQVVNEDAGAQSVAGFATNILAGPTDESGQQLNFIVGNDNAALFSQAPSIDATSGNLTYTLANDANGVANVTVQLMDNGGTANGGVDTSAQQNFSITVNAVNDAPSFNQAGNQTVNEDAGAQSVAGFASNILAGPADESGQQLNFIVGNDNAALFSQAPAIDASTGNLTYASAPDANGVANITVQLMDDGGTANGGVDTSAQQNFSITVNAVNDAPGFTAGPNQQAQDTDGAVVVSPWATGINAGPGDESGQSLNFIINSNSAPGLFAVQPSVASNGNLSFTPAVGQSGTANIGLRLMDDGGTANGGQNSSAVQTFDIVITTQPPTDLQITKQGDPLFIQDLEDLTYTITASNISAVDALGARVVDQLPATLDVANAQWTCVASGGATCAASGTGNIDELVDLPAGSNVVFTLVATVLAGTEGTLITNTATVTPPNGLADSDSTNNTDTELTDTGLFSDGFEGN